MHAAPYFSTRQFQRHSGFQYSAEVAELTNGGRNNWLGMIYDDAADAGFILVSHITNHTIRMALDESKTKRDGEGDVLYWILTSVPEDNRKFRLDQEIIITVYND